MTQGTTYAELTSWKEIAAHLGITVRTAQIWERDRGLPVHRRLGKHGRVSAHTTEIDAWTERVTSATHPRGEVPASEIDEVEGQPMEMVPAPASHPRRALFAAVFLLPLLFGAELTARWFWKSPQPAQWRFDHRSMIVLGQDGGELWRKDLDDLLPADENTRGTEQVFLHDFDFDGETEVVLSLTGVRDDAPDGALFCFSADGSSKWRFRTRESLGKVPASRGHNRDAIKVAYADFGRSVGKAFLVVVNYPDAPRIALVSPQDGQLVQPTAAASSEPYAMPLAASVLDQLCE